MKEKLLIIGNGMASVRLCEELSAPAPDRFETTVVGAEPRAGYNRVLLSALLAGDIGEADIALRGADWYGARGIRLMTGRRVEKVDTARRTVILGNAEEISYDKLLLAIGASSRRLDFGKTKPN